MPTRSVRPRPAFLRALGHDDPPVCVTVQGLDYQRDEIFKHDSWAATATYSRDSKRIICKFNRRQPIGLTSMVWLGQRLAERERHALERLDDLPNVPRSMGEVRVDGVVWPTAVAREYVPGHPMQHGEIVGPLFFPMLRRTLQLMHDRGIAYVDLHKRENILVGDDGWPYLIDFQIGMDVSSPRMSRMPGMADLFHVLCQSDMYHLQKHVLRHDPERKAEAEQELEALRPWWIKAHRQVAVPFRELRRKFLVAIGVRSGTGQVSSEAFIEDGLRAIPKAA